MRSSEFRVQSSKFKLPLFVFLIFSFVFAQNVFGQIASGGSYVLEKSVTAGGGASGLAASTNGSFKVEGTIGQFAVGAASQNAPFNFKPGFWTAAPLAPTAAAVNLGGRVLTPSGGVRNAQVMLTMPGGETRTVVTGSFGYYLFRDVPVGETYILTVYSKRFTFSNATQVVSLLDARVDVDFMADENY